MLFFKKKPKEEKPEWSPPPLAHNSTAMPEVEKVTRAQKRIMESYQDGGNNPAQGNEENYLSTSELVYSCVDYISKAASQATPKIYEIDQKTGEKKPIKDKKLAAWVNLPNPFWTWGDLIEMAVQGLLLSGNSYLTLETVKGSYETWFIGPPSKVDVVPDKTKYVKGYIYDDQITYKTDEVIHIKNPSMNNAYYGVPAVRPLLDTLLLEASAIDELSTFYKGSNIISGVLKSELPLTPEQIEELREQFAALYGQHGKYKRGTAVLPAKMDYKPIQANPKDALLLDSMDISEKRVLRVFKLNALVLGGEASSTTHPQELMKTVFNTAVRPYLYKIADQISLFLRIKFKKPGIVFEFDFDKIVELETSLDVKSSSAKTLYATGVATMNEARDLVGLAKIDSKYADMNILASYMFGSDFAYIQELDEKTRKLPSSDISSNNTNDNADNQQDAVGSTDPQGGAPDLKQ